MAARDKKFHPIDFAAKAKHGWLALLCSVPPALAMAKGAATFNLENMLILFAIVAGLLHFAFGRFRGALPALLHGRANADLAEALGDGPERTSIFPGQAVRSLWPSDDDFLPPDALASALAAGADPNFPLSGGESPLERASRSGHRPFVELLVAAGAVDPDGKASAAWAQCSTRLRISRRRDLENPAVWAGSWIEWDEAVREGLVKAGTPDDPRTRADLALAVLNAWARGEDSAMWFYERGELRKVVRRRLELLGFCPSEGAPLPQAAFEPLSKIAKRDGDEDGFLASLRSASESRLIDEAVGLATAPSKEFRL